MASLENQLQRNISEFINIDGHRKSYTQHYNALRDTIYSMLKADQPLGKWLVGHKLGGSYGDRVKITKPDEFDLVIYLKFPENNRIIVKKDPRKPGNVTLDMTQVLNILQRQEHNNATFTCLKKLVSASNLLLEDKLQNLLNGAFTRALTKMGNRIIVDGVTSNVVYKRCGPAHTIFITSPYKYSVDFVPAIRLDACQNVLGVEERKYFRNVQYWDAIPKPLKPFQANNISFRASYYDAERNMIHNKQKLKDVIKLMKKFRDSKTNMTNVRSYYIKTVLLWQVKVRPEAYWSNKRLYEILIDMYDELATCLAVNQRRGKLLFFWDPNLDMFAAFTQNQRHDMFNCVIAEHANLKRAAGNLTSDINATVRTSYSKWRK
ncbi:hypothetical protein KR093_007220 [Drosophila rubida]|uniref:Cyclic GMP-AMP synthase n=1 Tax=Drosophila rubida TaxID=30044 RepID=A0AAD4K306_9MUSC|nr:hypothetical protein KR093_007220 [Drosophila rubida]